MQLTTSVATSDPTTLALRVDGMNCEDCVRSVENILLKQPGITSAAVDLATATAIVKCDAGTEPLQIAQCLTQSGFPSHLIEVSTPAAHSSSWALRGLHILVVFFNLCLIAQVLTVGLAYFSNSEWWNIHVWLVRGYSGISLVLLAGVYLIPFPRRIRSLAASLPVLLGLQFLTIHLKTAIPLAIVHPLIGFTLFSVSTTLVHRVTHFLFPKADIAITPD